MSITIIVPARSEPEARRIAASRRIPDADWVWIAPELAVGYADDCAARGVPVYVLTDRPAARTVVVRSPHERSAA